MLKLVQSRTYLGANMHCGFAAIAGQLEIAVQRGTPFPFSPIDVQQCLVGSLSAFADAHHHVAVDETLQSGDADIVTAKLAAWFTAGLQNLAGAAVKDYGISLRRNALHAVSGYELDSIAVNAMQLACDMLDAALSGGDPAGFALTDSMRRRLDGLVTPGRVRHLDDATRAIVERAEERGIPSYRISSAGRFMQLGQGVRRHQIFEAWSTRTPVTANQMSRDKRVTHDVLALQGIPVPKQIWVSSLRQAESAAERIGYPVVVKPSHGLQGGGVAVDIRDAAELKAGYEAAAARRQGMTVVESYVPGDDHRLLVVGGRFLAGAQRVRAQIVGNGRDTIETLLAAYNADPSHGPWFVPPPVDDETLRLLRHQGYAMSDVPPAGERVYLRWLGGFSRGGATIDVTDRVHPDLQAMAEDAASALGLEIAGIDYITEDVSKSYRETGGAICEVNGCPNLAVHWIAGSQREAILDPAIDLLFPPGDTGRIPTVAITGSAGKTTTARMVASILDAAGVTAGVACSDGVSIGTRIAHEVDGAGGEWARVPLIDPRAQAAVLELSCVSLIRRGIAYDTCDVGAVLNISREHVGQEGIRSVEELAAVKAMVVATATHYVVLNADDAHCVRMAHMAKSTPICWVAEQPDNQVVRAHLQADGLALSLIGTGPDAEIAVLAGGNRPEPLLRLGDIPSAWGGALQANVKNALCAAAIGHVMGFSPEHIKAGLSAFRSDFANNPGRYNLFRNGRYFILLDRASAPAYMHELCGAVRRIPVKGRKILLMTHAGNRLDEDIRAVGTLAAGNFDHYVCYSSRDLRGRGVEEVPALLAAGLATGGIGPDQITIAPAQDEALAFGAELAQPEDLLTLLCLERGPALRQVLSTFGAA